MTNTKEINMDLLIDVRRERTYFEVPFQVPDNVAKLEVSYSYKRWEIIQNKNMDEYNREINIVDIAIRDESGTFRGWSGSERLNFYITENEATPGYVRGIINKGQWAVILGAYKIQASGCAVNLKVKFTFKERVLLKGDAHMHTYHSDGKYDISSVINVAKLHGMDFIFITDHNTFSQNDYINTSDSLMVIPGMEWTHYSGHCNFLGIKRPVKNFVANEKKKVVGIMNEARDNGALVVLNHPFCPNCGWKWGFDVPFDVVEIWNGPIKKAEYDAIAWWNERICQGEIIPIVGGSDSHKNELFRMIGTPTTFLYCDSRGESDIIKAIKKGHGFISYCSTGPVIELSIGNAIMGDTIKFQQNQTGTVKVRNTVKGDIIRLITDRGVEIEDSVNDESTKVINFNVENRKFYRIEVWRTIIPQMPHLLASISNPIYIKG